MDKRVITIILMNILIIILLLLHPISYETVCRNRQKHPVTHTAKSISKSVMEIKIVLMLIGCINCKFIYNQLQYI